MPANIHGTLFVSSDPEIVRRIDDHTWPYSVVFDTVSVAITQGQAAALFLSFDSITLSPPEPDRAARCVCGHLQRRHANDDAGVPMTCLFQNENDEWCVCELFRLNEVNPS